MSLIPHMEAASAARKGGRPFERIVTLDFEARSEVDLKKVGAFVYSKHPSTQIMCAAAAVDEGPIQLWKETDNISIHDWLMQFEADDTLWSFHNADMEWNMLAHKCDITLPIERVIDSAAVARHANLPGKLEELADFYYDTLGISKDMEGHRIMMKLCRPRKASKDNKDRFWFPATKPDDFEALYSYCKGDVSTQRICLSMLPPMTLFEIRVFQTTFRANQRGMPVDVSSATKLQHIAKYAKEELSKAIHAKYGFTLGQVADIAAYLGLADVAKNTIRDLLKDPSLDERHREVAEARKTFAKSSTAKIDALLHHAQIDGHIHGGIVYGGAERTLRFSGRGFQAQNLVRGLGKLQADAYVALDADMLEFMFDDILSTIAGMLRGLITHICGIYFGDFSQIEARLLGWFAGDAALLEIFRTGGDPYKVAASKIYNVPLESVTPDQRFMGKQSVLACLSPETSVVTRRGVVDLIDVTKEDELWDGVEWVRHQGVIYMGVKPTISHRGLVATRDHLMLCGTKWVPWSEVREQPLVFASALSSATLPLLDMNERSSGTTKAGGGYLFAAAVSAATKTLSCLITSTINAVPGAMFAPNKHLPKPQKDTGGMKKSSQISNIAAAFSTALHRPILVAQTQNLAGSSTMVGAVSPLASLIGESFFGTLSRCRAGISQSLSWIGSTTTKVMRLATCASQPKLSTPQTNAALHLCKSASQSLRPVYDIAHAGPRNRFTVLTDAGPIIVHNCGYGLGQYGFQSLLDTTYDVQVSDDEAKAVVYGFRENNPLIVKFWERIGNVMEQAYNNIGARLKITPKNSSIMLSLQFTDKNTFNIKLPSGRKLNFYKVERDAKGNWECFSRLKTGGYGQRKIYPGLICGVIVQSTARELVARSMVRLDEEGFDFILTVHDENVAIGDGRFDLFKQIMLEQPDWLTDFPMGADVVQTVRYRK